MKAVLMLSALALLLANPAAAQNAAAEKEVAQLFNTLNDANIKKDRPTIERLTADDFIYIHSNGSVTNRVQEIAEAMSAATGWTGSKIDDLRVRVYGEVAIVTGLNTLTGATKGYVSGGRRFTDVWVRRNGQWKTVGGQSTVVQK
jgi:hypothetical protein